MNKPDTPDTSVPAAGADLDRFLLKITGFAALTDLFCTGMSETESERLCWDTQHFAFLASHYRERFENDKIILSHDEAVEAYRLLSPLIRVSQDPIVYCRMMVSRPLDTGGLALDPRIVEALLREHEDDACFEGKEPWDGYLTHEALVHSVECMERKERTEALDPDWHWLLDRCRDALEGRPVTRPCGGPDPRIYELRDALVTAYLQLLDGCGLTVTSRNGVSLAGAMAKATDISHTTINKIWECAGTGVGAFPSYRDDKHSRDRSSVPCIECGQPVERQRLLEGLSQRCERCADLGW